MQDYRDDNDLISVLEHASKEDLVILIDIITDSGKGRVSLSDEKKTALIQAKPAPLEVKYLLAEEIQKFGGNSVVSIFRGGKGVFYKEIVCDVADHVGANYNDKQSTAQIESAVLLKIVEKSLEKMSESERKEFFEGFGIRYDEGIGPAAMAALIVAIKASGFAFYKLATIVAQAAAKALLGRGLTFAATGSLMRGISVFAGPVGWAITGIWTAFDLASPAYRVTVPCVIQLAYMRQKSLISECPACREVVSKEMKFCGGCGHKLN